MYSTEIISDLEYYSYQGDHVYPFKDTINLNLKLGGSINKSYTSPIGLGLTSFNREIDMGFDYRRLRSLGDILDSNSTSEVQSPSPYILFDAKYSNNSTRYSLDVNEPPDSRRMLYPSDHMESENSKLFECYYPEFENVPISKQNLGNIFPVSSTIDQSNIWGQETSSLGEEADRVMLTKSHKIEHSRSVPTLSSCSDYPGEVGNITEKLFKKFAKKNLDRITANIQCSHCDEEFKSYLELSSHIDTYKLIRIHKCPVLECPYNLIGFDKKALLRHHVISYHFNKGSLLPEYYQYAQKLYSLIYKCNDKKCGKCFYRRDSLSRHTKLVHNNKLSKFNLKIAKEGPDQNFTSYSS